MQRVPALRHRYATIRIAQPWLNQAVPLRFVSSSRDPMARARLLSREMGVVHFVNPDLIAGGLSPLRPELAAFTAGRLFLRELNRLAKSEEDFAFESTLSGLAYMRLLQRWKAAGRRIEIAYLRISSPQLGLRRIAARVRQGGHNVPRRDVLRRFKRSWINFEQHYRLLADAWSVYDNSGSTPKLLERSP